MISKTSILEIVLQRLRKLPIGHYIEVRTYKRNRGVLFVRQDEATFLVIEDGYVQERFEALPYEKIKKLFKVLLQREFPRSTKVRLYAMGEFDESGWKDVKRKTL